MSDCQLHIRISGARRSVIQWETGQGFWKKKLCFSFEFSSQTFTLISLWKTYLSPKATRRHIPADVIFITSNDSSEPLNKEFFRCSWYRKWLLLLSTTYQFIMCHHPPRSGCINYYQIKRLYARQLIIYPQVYWDLNTRLERPCCSVNVSNRLCTL